MRHRPVNGGDLERLCGDGEESEMTRQRRPCVGEGASEVVPWRRRAEVDGDWEWGWWQLLRVWDRARVRRAGRETRGVTRGRRTDE
jgi:hypothetical protein